MVLIVKFVDRHLGNLLCGFLGIFNKKRAIGKSNVNRILIIQLWGVGESILTLPSIEALRKRFPKAEISLLSTPRNGDVYYKNKDIDSIMRISLNPFSVFGFILKNWKKYDLVIDTEEYLNISAIMSFFAGKSSIGYSHGPRAKLYSEVVRYNDKQHVVQTFLDLVRLMGISYDTDKLPLLNFSKNDENFVERLLKSSGIKKNDFVVCVAPGAAESAKSRIWPYDRYAELCDEIMARHKAKVIFTGTHDESELIEEIQKKMENKAINAAGKLSLTQLFCLIGKCSLFIGNDAGPMHVAAAQGIKTLGLFGPNLPLRFGPYGKGNTGLYKGYNCQFSPCINVHKGQVPDCLYPRNSNDYQKCMKNISVDDALKEVEKLVSR